jgi:hypothetical protein
MGVHHAPRSSSHAARLAGRGALTAAAALALAGGTASLAFASEVPSVPTTQDIAGHAKTGTQDLQKAAKASKAAPGGSKVSAHDVSGAMKQHASQAKGKAGAAASTLEGHAKSLPVSDVKADAKHAASNTKNDAQHAAHNWAGAAKGGVTPSEASHQVGLMSNDVKHAAHHGQADTTHLTGSAPQLGALST